MLKREETGLILKMYQTESSNIIKGKIDVEKHYSHWWLVRIQWLGRFWL